MTKTSKTEQPQDEEQSQLSQELGDLLFPMETLKLKRLSGEDRKRALAAVKSGKPGLTEILLEQRRTGIR